MRCRKCLFAAPYGFIPEIQPRYDAVMPTDFIEVWDRVDLPRDARVTALVCHPGYSFRLDAALLDAHFPNLEVLVTASTGNNHVAVDEVREHGIAFYSLLDDREALEEIAASAEGTFLLLLNALKGRGIAYSAGEVKAGRWRMNEDGMRGRELQGKRVGVIGMGRIGRRIQRYCKAFGAHVTCYDPYVEPDAPTFDSLEALFDSSDIVVVSCTLSDETRQMIGAPLLRRLKDDAVFVNSARAEIVDEAALADVLRAKPDIRVGLDVIAGEHAGRTADSPLLPFLENWQITITPHIAGATNESQAKAAMIALSLVKRHYSLE